MRGRLAVAGLILLGLVTLGIAWIIGMRDKSSAVVRAQRRINKSVINPQQMRTAGKSGSPIAIIRHTGRRSHRDYENPVGAFHTEDGFVVALVYGRESDWAKNVLANGHATIVHDGRASEVDRPEVVPFHEVAHHFSPEDRRGMRSFSVTECIVLHTRGSGSTR